jgi:DNA-binding transcriptional LysR family regulator
MDLRALSLFTTVADTGSFTRAAERAGISQSAVSQQIRALEESLGTSLFSRHARKVTLTQAGNVLLPYARQILRKTEEARAVVSDFEAMGRGRISLGAGGALCHHVVPALLKEFAERFTRIEIQVRSGFTDETLRRTLEGTVDIGLLLLPIEESSVVVTELGRDELVAIAPAGHRWADLERVRPRDFVGENLVSYDRTSETYRILERFLLEGGVFASVGMEISDLEAVKEMVKAGLGVSVVAGWAVRKEQQEGSLVARSLAPRGLYRTWGAVRRSNETLTASQRALLAICETRFPGLVA